MTMSKKKKGVYKTKTWVGRIFISLDQLGNALAGGNPDATISQRLGYFNAERPMKATNLLMKLVDWTFKPVDGEGHCRQAYEMSTEEHMRGNDVALGIMGVILAAVCPILRPIVWSYSKMTKNVKES